MREEFESSIEPKDCTAYYQSAFLEKSYIESSEFQDIKIKWSVDLHSSKYGFSGHIKTVSAISGTLITKHYLNDKDEEDEPIESRGVFTFFINEKFETCVNYKSKKYDLNLLLELEFNFEPSGNLYPSEVEVDFKNHKFTVK